MGMREGETGKPGIRFLRLRDLPGVELYQIVRGVRANPRHVHSLFALTVCEEGSAIHRTREGAFPMTPGSLAVINCGEAHSGGVPSGACASSRTIRLQPGYLAECLGQFAGGRPEALRLGRPVVHDPALARSVLGLFDLLERPGSRMEKEEGLLELLAALSARAGRPPAAPPQEGRLPIRRACDLLRARCSEPLPLATLAAVAGMSPYHFAKLFTRQVGVAPHAFQTQLRLQKATDLLAAGASCVEAALESGFCDQSHLCRAFKKKFGIAPARYRC